MEVWCDLNELYLLYLTITTNSKLSEKFLKLKNVYKDNFAVYSKY